MPKAKRALPSRCRALIYNEQTRRSGFCNKPTLKDKATCKEHTDRGDGAPLTAGGIWSKWLPPRLLDTYQQLLQDPDPYNMLNQYTFLHTMAIDKLRSMNGSAPIKLWSKVKKLVVWALKQVEEDGIDEEAHKCLETAVELLEQVGAIRDAELDLRTLIREMGVLVEVETRRAERQKAYITPEQAMALVAALTTVIMNAIEETDGNDPNWKEGLRERIARDFIRVCSKSNLQKTHALENQSPEQVQGTG